MSRFSSVVAVSLSSILVLAAGCKKSTKSEPKGDTAAPQATTPPSKRAGLKPLRSLLTEARRAELRTGGLVIDFGTADQHKYTRGGWGTGWSQSEDGAKTEHAVLGDKTGSLSLLLTEPPQEIRLRAKSAGAPQTLTLRANDRDLGKVTVESDWSVLKVATADLAGDQRVTLTLGRDGEEPVWIDWLALPLDKGAKDPQLLARSLPVSLKAGVRRGLIAPTARTYSFYLHPPADGILVFDTGSSAAVPFAVTADTADGKHHQLFSGTSEPGQWTEQVVDLSPLGGQAARLNFATAKDALSTAWGEPTIYVAKEEEAPKPKALAAGAPAKNLIVIVLDTTRADSFRSLYPDTVVETPAYEGFAEHATLFTNAYNNENWTKPSVTTLLSGLYPMTHGARYAKSIVPDEVTLLSQHLDNYGFQTTAMISNAVVSEAFNFDRGWDQFDNLADGDEANGYPLYRRAAKWLDERPKDERFFLYIQSIDAHTTYEVPSEYTSRYFKGSYNGKFGQAFDRTEQVAVDNYSTEVSKTDLDWIKALYQGEVTFQDEQLGVFLAKVEELGLWDDTIVVVTNDHGEEFRDHDHMGHGWTLYDEMIRAPLAIRAPSKFPAATRIPEVIEHVDVAPTLVEALELPPMRDIDGLSFLGLFSDRPFPRQPFYAVTSSRNQMRSVRVGQWKLIVGETKGWLKLFNVEKDPRELENHIDDALIAGRLCEVYLGEALAAPSKLDRQGDAQRQRALRASDATLDPKTRRQLESLGYL